MKNTFCPNKDIKDTKVVVAMSGGVDSSVVATMLHRQGYQVIGVTLQLYDHGVALEKKGACCAGQDIYDAKQVADKAGFPHYVLNYESIFKESVMDDFADSYLRGETPIPCVKCNQSVKFRDLFKVAKDLNADALVTGHYVQRIDNEAGFPELHKAVDDSKDQSYFLFATTKEQLNYIHFPLGGLKKEKTRELALEYGLEVADKPDSQDICFVPNGSYAKVIERLRPEAWETGDIVNVKGEKLGEHKGIVNYTIGQRRGLGIGGGDPLYVVKIDAKKNQVIVGAESDLDSYSFGIKDINWLGSGDIPSEGMEVTVKMRSTQSPVNAKIFASNDNAAKIVLNVPERAIAPGQACVFYDGSRVLGGGWITKD
ncbi:MAG: tRNA 2-thiouridine(34) synthase MnmA [Alphaproteobacteria bacterium CG11_big_fil_rev_8_21_14_0_20_39_49]|nr:MAG: tRNA 2-thiouridine(34) synthase MnmA [Alphaproteobacteria bacterium CG11_big_fil_rev_8_21_14_0_20_39_49]